MGHGHERRSAAVVPRNGGPPGYPGRHRSGGIVREAERLGAPEPVLKALHGMAPVEYHNKKKVLRSAKTRVAEETPEARRGPCRSTTCSRNSSRPWARRTMRWRSG